MSEKENQEQTHEEGIDVMDYRLMNISNERFQAEGIDIAPKQVSVELSPELYQKLLSVYLGNPLMPVDENELERIEKEKSNEGSHESAVPSVDVSPSATTNENKTKKSRGAKKKILSTREKESSQDE